MGLAPGFKLHTCLSLTFMSAKAWRCTLGFWPAPGEKAGKVEPRAQVSPASDATASRADAAALRRGDPTTPAGGAGTVRAPAAPAEANVREVVRGVQPHHADRARTASPAWAPRAPA